MRFLKLSLLIFSFTSITGYCEIPSRISQNSSCEQFRKGSFPFSRPIRRGYKSSKMRAQASQLTPCSISCSSVTSKTFCSCFSATSQKQVSSPLINHTSDQPLSTVVIDSREEEMKVQRTEPSFFANFTRALTNQIPAIIFNEKKLVLSLLSLADDEWMQYRNFPPPEYQQPVQGDRPHLLNWPPLPFSQQNKGDFMNHPMPQQNQGPGVYHQYHQ